MVRTVADTIRELTRAHIADNNGLVLGQCLSAVGWVQNTVPAQEEGIKELPMTDISGAGIAVGAALTGRRPIFVIRFQSLVWLNASPLVNYAAKAKSTYGYPCPLFIRASADEGNGMGPVHSGVHYAPFMMMPGLPVTAPMTPEEYLEVWSHYMTHDDPMFVSEHRFSYKNSEEMPDQIHDDAELTIFAISATRIHALEAVKQLNEEGVKVNLIHLYWLSPFKTNPEAIGALKKTGKGLVLDSGFEVCGASRSIAYELSQETNVNVRALGMEDRSSGVAKRYENLSPSPERIKAVVKEMLNIS
jgi:acetoin:2,6-dichlorophenolindophenol oxidoreductase subunit beta